MATATAPKAKTEKAPPYAPCPTCGAMVLAGATPTGARVTLDVAVRTYTVLWTDTALPTLHASRGYPVHACRTIAATSHDLR